jgi:hypothetical protein
MPEEAEWLGDEEGEPLPVLPAERVAAPSRRRRRLQPVPKGNTPAAAAPEVRSAALTEAQGRAPKEPEEWREQLSLGQRERAASALSRQGSQPGSGFGLA